MSGLNTEKQPSIAILDLSIVSHINRIYLLRESTEFGKDFFDAGTSFCYLDIDLFKFSINNFCCAKQSNNGNYKQEIYFFHQSNIRK